MLFLLTVLPFFGTHLLFSALCWLWAAITPIRKVAFSPNFLKHMWRWSLSLKLWVLALSEVRWFANRCFHEFFERKCFLPIKPSIFDPIVFYIFGKLSIWPFQKWGWKSIFDILWSVRIFVTPVKWYFALYRNLVLSGIGWMVWNLSGHLLQRRMPGAIGGQWHRVRVDNDNGHFIKTMEWSIVIENKPS